MTEEKKMIQFIRQAGLCDDAVILDVGCGYGRNIRQIQAFTKYRVRGVDINERIVKKNKEEGLDCLTIEEFEDDDEMFDMMIFSHIIEHFSPEDLLFF